jgi:hypothetical protein
MSLLGDEPFRWRLLGGFSLLGDAFSTIVVIFDQTGLQPCPLSIFLK